MSCWFPIPRSAEAATVIPRSRLAALLKEERVAAHAKRLALELECLLLSCNDTAATSRWWDTAHDALANYQADLDRLYPPEHPTFMGEPVVAKEAA